jgi:HlyD family secretion protein
MKSKRFLIVGGIILLILVFVGYRMLSGIQEARASLANVQTATIERGTLMARVGASGTVRSLQSAQVAWQANGQVGKVEISLGEQVEADQLLATLDPATLSQAILQAQVDLINAQEALDNLYKVDTLRLAQAKTDLEEAEKALDDLLNPSAEAIAQAELAVVDAREEVKTMQYRLNSLINGRGNQQLISEARAKYLLAQNHVDDVQAAYESTPGDPEVDAHKALALSNLAAAERDRDRALGSLNWYLGEPSEEEMAEGENNLALAEARLVNAEKALADLQSPSQTDLTLAQARVEDAEQALDSLMNGPSENDILIAETRLTQAEAALNQAQLVAPFTGIVTEIQALPGDLVSPGTPAFRIDDLSTLLVDLSVSELDINQVHPGQKVTLAFDSIIGQEYNGTVVEVASFGEILQGVVNFNVTVEVTDADQQVRPGMTAAVEITISELSDVLLVPNRAVRSIDGERVVYVMKDGVPEAVPLTLGKSSDLMSEVLGGDVKEGDQVVLNPQASIMQFGPNGGGGFGGGSFR